MPIQTALAGYFLPYQTAWLNDPARLKIWEKSRRIGATDVQADVRDCAKKGGCDVWFTSADQATSKEYIRYCADWARILNAVAKDMGEVALDEDKGVKVLAEFANGRRIHALSSNPRALRGRGGKLVVDEYAHHDQSDELWRAAQAVATWGHSIRVLSTHNGKGCRFYRMVQDAKQGDFTHSVLAFVKKSLLENWQSRPRQGQGGGREYHISPFHGTPRGLVPLQGVGQRPTSSWRKQGAGEPAGYHGGACYVGMEFGRRGDLTVIWVGEKMGDVGHAR